jgi:hypothetical protein
MALGLVAFSVKLLSGSSRAVPEMVSMVLNYFVESPHADFKSRRSRSKDFL